MGRRRTRRAFPPSRGSHIGVASSTGSFLALVCRVAAIVSRNSHSNGLSLSSSKARLLSSRTAAPSKSESGLEGATRRVRMCKRTRSSHSSARPYRSPSHVPNPSYASPSSHSLHDTVQPPYSLLTLPCTPATVRLMTHCFSSTLPSSISYASSSVGYDVPALSCLLTGPLSEWASCARVLSHGPTSRAHPPLP